MPHCAAIGVSGELQIEDTITSDQRTGPPGRREVSDTVVVDVLSADKLFSNGTRALAPIDLSVREGEFVSLIGPSGCGKSTLLKLIANLYEPTDGRIRWWRGDFSRVGQPGKRLAFVFQDPTLMPWARVDANVRLALDLERQAGGDESAKVATALEQVGLTQFARHYPRQLSGGMRMRVSIARALVDSPDLLLMDEPFGALDEFTRNKLDIDLAQLSWERGLTTLFVTHSIYEAVFLSTRIVVMATNPGRMFGQLMIDEKLPRGEDYRDSERFSRLCRELSAMLAAASNDRPGRD
jgi:NitT/TauT family transport system ATP-binding protein